MKAEEPARPGIPAIASVPIIDADTLAREVVQPGQPALAEIAVRFPGVVAPDGQLDRAKLGARIFADSFERAALNAITHPRIQALAREKSAALAAAGEEIAIYDAALLIENRLHEGLSGVILVVCPPQVQMARLMERNGLSEEEAGARIAAQMPLEKKRPFATWIVDNGGSPEATRAQVQEVISEWVR